MLPWSCLCFCLDVVRQRRWACGIHAVADARVMAVLVHRKGKRTEDPLVFHYDRSPEAAFVSSPLALLDRSSRMRPTSDAFYTLAEEEDLSASTTSHAVATPTSALSFTAPVGCTYSSHSERIGACNELLALSFPIPWIMYRMGWESEGMLRGFITIRASLSPTTRAGFSLSSARCYNLMSVAGPGRSAWPVFFGPSCCVDYVYTCEDKREIASG
jgi:hypothetical protein